MTWRQRARRRARALALRSLFPEQRAAIDDPTKEVLFVAVPFHRSLLDARSAVQRAEVCEYIGGMARIEAVHAVRRRVGSSAKSPAQEFMTGWTGSTA